MKLICLTQATAIAGIITVAFAGGASAQGNPLLQQNTVNAESSFEAQARAIDLAATKDSNDPVCQNIRANYDAELSKIVNKSEAPQGMSLSQINQFSYNGSGTLSRLNRMNRNLTGNYSGTLGKMSNKIGRGSAIANDAAAIGGMLGLGGKMSQKKAEKKAAKLDAQALDAVKQTGCPMSTFN